MFVPTLPKGKITPASPEPPPPKKWGITLGRAHGTVTLLAYTETREAAEAALRDLAIGISNDLEDWACHRGELVFYQVPKEGEPPYVDLEHR